jgi:hypothetical protein
MAAARIETWRIARVVDFVITRVGAYLVFRSIGLRLRVSFARSVLRFAAHFSCETERGLGINCCGLWQLLKLWPSRLIWTVRQ